MCTVWYCRYFSSWNLNGGVEVLKDLLGWDPENWVLALFRYALLDKRLGLFNLFINVNIVCVPWGLYQYLGFIVRPRLSWFFLFSVTLLLKSFDIYNPIHCCIEYSPSSKMLVKRGIAHGKWTQTWLPMKAVNANIKLYNNIN